MKVLLLAAALLFSAASAFAQEAVRQFPFNAPVLSTTVTAVKLSQGNITGGICANPNASVVFVQMFDTAKASNVTLGTTTPTASVPLAVSNAITAIPAFSFLKGMSVAVTTTATGNTAAGTASNCVFTFN